ncbi:Xaa-Pro peptidase family protein [[Ruminococcus] gnavus]|uniref:M24 family metallopeptidase n=1 Tax=Mediterraneibacter gnavus TaxID=33038 RepID=UPI00210DB88C|nr:Xaa-Pro peptidase family protein [Mediterraneibacter gnavus]MCQ4701690.1 Xaa-Pro peptidase family protein [Mediterraneibacter gnavus]
MSNHGKIFIPDHEYKERVTRAAKILQREKLDAMIVNSNEADYANARYFSGFWPLFERSGVAISASGDAALMVGPESREFAADRSRLEKIFVLKEYRESADPAYPELKADTYQDVFHAIGVNGKKLRIGVASYLDTSVIIMEGIKAAFPEAEIVRADHIMVELRSIKSVNEINCLREGYRIAELATQQVIKEIQPGMTELQMVGVAERVVYEQGAEYEGLPMYVFSEASTRHAISRSSYREFQKGDIVQLNLSAKIDGYSAAIGYPIVLGKLEGKRRDVVMFGLEAHKWTQQQVKSGIPASQIAENFYKYYVDNGYKDNFVYGPLHGTGMIEVEAPWVETTSDYALKPNMTFQIDTFISTDTFGVRWEKGIAVTEDGCDVLSPEIGKLYELEF